MSDIEKNQANHNKHNKHNVNQAFYYVYMNMPFAKRKLFRLDVFEACLKDKKDPLDTFQNWIYGKATINYNIQEIIYEIMLKYNNNITINQLFPDYETKLKKA